MTQKKKCGRPSISDDSVRKLLTLPRDVSEYITAHGGSAFVVELVEMHRKAERAFEERVKKAVADGH